MVPYVSIIIPTYNRRLYLPAAIDSVLAQTLVDWELIVVDDGSADGTTDAIQPYLPDDRVRYVSRPHVGRSAARNHGAQMARGEWLAFLDADDRYLPAGLAAHAAVVRNAPDTALTLGGYEYVDDEGRWLGERQPWDESGLSLGAWLFNCLGLPGSFMIRRDWFEQVQGFDTRFHMAEDWDLFLRLAQAGCPMHWTRASVCQYRQHSASSIHNLALHCESSLRALEKVFQRPDLPGDIAALAPRAKAWVYVVFARRAFAAGLAESAVQDLQQALALDPALAGNRRPQLLETLFSREMVGQQTEGDMEAAVTPYLPAALKRHPADIRRAQARVHMARFFRADSDGTQRQAAAHLRAGVRLDPRWLLNPGVLSYCVRKAFRHAPDSTPDSRAA